jgi:hypothetical protein
MHTFYEVFATMTGRGIRVTDKDGQPGRLVMSAKDAAVWLRAFANRLHVVELDRPEVLDALDAASGRGVMGGLVYDYGHVQAAEKVGASKLLSRNGSDFQAVAAKVSVEWP